MHAHQLLDNFADSTFQPLANAIVRIALSMSLFKHIPTDKGTYVNRLAKLYNADIDMTRRITRGLVHLFGRGSPGRRR